jgi:hypothetical protein
MESLKLIALGFCLSSVAASADLIPLNTENTGQQTTTSSGTTTDNNWLYSNFYNVDGFGAVTAGTPGTLAIVVTTQPAGWISDSGTTPVGFWLGPGANQSGSSPGGDAPGIYAYQLTFTSTTARAVLVSGEMAADNNYEIAYGSSVVGATIEVQAPGTGAASVGSTISSGNTYGFDPSTLASGTQQYGSLSPFSFILSVAAGSTTLDFLVLNQNNNMNNPTGLYVTDFAVVATPEPSTWAIVIMGLVTVTWARYRALRGAACTGVSEILLIGSNLSFLTTV